MFKKEKRFNLMNLNEHGFMIRFWEILGKNRNAKSLFWIQKSGFGFSQNKYTSKSGFGNGFEKDTSDERSFVQLYSFLSLFTISY